MEILVVGFFFQFLSYLPLITEINGPITKKLKEQELLVLPMTHILIN